MPNLAAGLVSSILLTAAIAGAAAIEGNSIRVSITSGAESSETVQIRENGAWIDALKTSGAVIQTRGAEKCAVQSADVVNSRLVVKGLCPNGAFTRSLELGRDSDTISVTVQFTPAAGAAISSVEDRMIFAPATRKSDTPVLGPLDFVWSPGIKAQRVQVAAHWTFKSPSVMFQQGSVFAAIVPALDSLTSSSLRYQPMALDLDVTSEDHAWFSYGVVESKPYGHSYFLRTDARLDNPAGPIEYRYWILASSQSPKLGYRRVSQFEWEKFGSAALRASLDLQRNDRRPELFLFDDWRQRSVDPLCRREILGIRLREPSMRGADQQSESVGQMGRSAERGRLVQLMVPESANAPTVGGFTRSIPITRKSAESGKRS